MTVHEIRETSAVAPGHSARMRAFGTGADLPVTKAELPGRFAARVKDTYARPASPRPSRSPSRVRPFAWDRCRLGGDACRWGRAQPGNAWFDRSSGAEPSRARGRTRSRVHAWIRTRIRRRIPAGDDDHVVPDVCSHSRERSQRNGGGMAADHDERARRRHAGQRGRDARLGRLLRSPGSQTRSRTDACPSRR